MVEELQESSLSIYETVSANANLTFEYGHLITREWLLQQFSLREPSYGSKKDFEDFAFEFLQDIEEFKRIMLTEHKKLLISVRGRGYRICLPNQQVKETMDAFKRDIDRATGKATLRLININEHLLTSDEIRSRDDSHGRIAAIHAFSGKRLS